MGKFYDNSIVPDHMKRDFDVYDRINELNMDLGTFEENVTSLKGAGICGIIFQAGYVFFERSQIHI